VSESAAKAVAPLIAQLVAEHRERLARERAEADTQQKDAA
jgi:hypothetical protein